MNIWDKIYPDTKEGAIQFLNNCTIFTIKEGEAEPDPFVKGVWKVTWIEKRYTDIIAMGEYRKVPVLKEIIEFQAIVYLKGYPDPGGKIREWNDWEITKGE
jgi:hypothetical protein